MRRAAVLLALPLLCGAAPPAALTEVAPGLYVRVGATADADPGNEDGIANIGFIVGDEAVAVIDPGGSLADGEALRAALRARTPLPVRYVIETHVHPDHVFGAPAFAADHPTYVGHARLPAAIAARGAYYRKRLGQLLGPAAAGAMVVPGFLVQGDATLDLGHRVLRLHAHAPAHTDNDLSVLDTRTRTLWAADLLFVHRIPSLDGSVTGWLRELAWLRGLGATRAVPGHGPAAVPWPAGAADEQRYLETLARETRAVIARGGDIEEAVRSVGLSERGRWALFDDYNGHNVTVAYKELEWE